MSPFQTKQKTEHKQNKEKVNKTHYKGHIDTT